MDERSGSGQPIVRHREAVPSRLSGGDAALVEAIDAHIGRHFDGDVQVFHEVISTYVHVDVHVVEPTEARPAYTLVTSGMSERPMASPVGECYAELMLLLPPTWPGPGTEEVRSDRAYWPYRLLKKLARLPHAYDTWLWVGHTVPNGDPPEPYAPDTKLCGALVAPPRLAPDGFQSLTFGERLIRFFSVIPLHADEMQLKLDEGLDRLYDLFDEARLTELLDKDRPSVVPRKRRGFFRR